MALFDLNLGLSASMASSLNNLNLVNRAATSSLQRIETGQRYNHAADNPSAVVKAGDLAGDITSNQGAIDRNNEYLGDLDGVMASQDSILGTLNDMKKTLNDLMSATSGQASIASKYSSLAGTIDNLAQSATFNGTRLGTGSAVTSSITVNAGGGVASTSGTYSLVFDDLTATSLTVTTAFNGTTASAATTELAKVNAAIDKVMTASGKVSAGKSVLENNNTIMSQALTGWSQAYNSLVQVDESEESAILSALQSRQSAIQASMGYQAQFIARSSSISFTA